MTTIVGVAANTRVECRTTGRDQAKQEGSSCGGEHSVGSLTILAICSTYDSHKFFNLAALLRFASRGYGVLNAMTDMIAKNFLLQPSQSRAYSRNLGDDVDAITVLLHHSGEPTNLALNPREAFCA